MAQMIIALITPRAGEWNHRYIIPGNQTWNDAQLARALQILESSKTGQPGIIKSELVRQQGGRFGMEKLFFYCEGFETLDSQIQKKCQEKLDDWFANQRNSMFEKVDWSIEGKKQTVRRSELNGLCDDLQSVTGTVCSSKTGGRKSSCCLKGGCAMLALVMGVALVLFAGQVEKSEKWLSNLFHSSEEVKSTVPQTNEDIFENKKEIAQKMFVWSTSDKDELPQLNADELEKALDQIFPERSSEWDYEKPRNLTEYFNNPEIQKLIEEINNGKSLIVFGPQKGKWDILDGIDPVKFHEVLEMCTEWVNKKKADEDGEYEWKYQKDRHIYKARFYWSSTDIDDAKTLRKWLLDITYSKEASDKHKGEALSIILLDTLKPDKGELDECIERRVGKEKKENFKDLLKGLLTNKGDSKDHGLVSKE